MRTQFFFFLAVGNLFTRCGRSRICTPPFSRSFNNRQGNPLPLLAPPCSSLFHTLSTPSPHTHPSVLSPVPFAPPSVSSISLFFFLDNRREYRSLASPLFSPLSVKEAKSLPLPMAHGRKESDGVVSFLLFRYRYGQRSLFPLSFPLSWGSCAADAHPNFFFLFPETKEAVP